MTGEGRKENDSAMVSPAYEEAQRTIGELRARQRELEKTNEDLRRKVGVYQNSEDKIRTIFAALNDGILIADSATQKYVDVNSAMCRMMGYTREEILNFGLADLHPLEDLPDVRAKFENAVNANAGQFDDMPMLRKDGSVFPADLSHTTVTLNGANLAVGIFRDITERKQSLSLLKATLQSTEDGILVVARNGRIADFNEQFAKMWGMPKAILDFHDDQKALDFVLDQLMDPEQFIAKVRELYAHPETTSFDVLEFKDGRVFERYSQPQKIDSKPVGRVWSFRDITERRKTERALRVSENKYRTLFEAANDGIFIQDGKGFRDCNECGAKMYGLPKEQIIGRSPAEFAPERQPDGRLSADVAGERIQAALNGVPQVFEWRPLRADGRAIDVEITLSRLELDGFVCLQAIVRDITKRKQAEKQIARSLREKEVLLKEIHHRVKNNMQVIYSLLNLQAQGISDDTVRAKFEESRNRVSSMALIHERLYQSKDLAHIDFKDYLRSLVADVADTYRRHDVRVSVDMEPVALDVNVGIPCGLIVNELVSNSFKYAFPEGQTGSIRVGIHGNGEANYVLFVEDDGIGFPADVDFRSTASLGLQLVNGLAGQIQGKLELSREAGTGFTITFPVSAARKGKHG